MKYFLSIGFLLANLCSGFITKPFKTPLLIRSHIAYASPIENNYQIDKFNNFNLKESFENLGSNNDFEKNNQLNYFEKKDFFYAKEYYDFLIEYEIIKKPGFLLQGNTDYTKYAKEREKNYRIFEKNLLMIEEYNENNENCKLEINHFADEIDFYDTNNELSNRHKKNGNIVNEDFYAVSKILKNPIEYLKMYSSLPPKKIWGNNILPKVKNQGRCGSCWAFSTTSSVESLMRINNHSVERLSEQQLVDCSKKNNGCNGGLMHLAYQYIIENNGLLNNKDYEYVAKDQPCKINKEGSNSCECKDIEKLENVTESCNCKNEKKNAKGSEIKDYEFIIPKSKIDIMASLQNGPVALALDASPFVFRFYKEGVIDIPSSQSSNINHAVLLTGYDRDVNGTYWIIQNSWGEKWGDNGYAKIRATDDEGVLLSQIYGVYPKY
jgi:KDEL-tailed cysteine endopeptidase